LGKIIKVRIINPLSTMSMVNNPIFIHVTYLIILISVYSCGHRKQEPPSTIDITLNSIKVNHVVEKRNGCRFTQLEFNATIFNSTNQDRHFTFTKLENNCDRNIPKSTVNWVNQGKYLPLVVKDMSPSISVYKNDSIRINLRSAFTVGGVSIKNILYHYDDWLAYGKIIYHNGDTITFKKAGHFNVILILDESIVEFSDSISLSKSLSFPLDDLNIDSIIGETPNEEPEL